MSEMKRENLVAGDHQQHCLGCTGDASFVRYFRASGAGFPVLEAWWVRGLPTPPTFPYPLQTPLLPSSPNNLSNERRKNGTMGNSSSGMCDLTKCIPIGETSCSGHVTGRHFAGSLLVVISRSVACNTRRKSLALIEHRHSYSVT